MRATLLISAVSSGSQNILQNRTNLFIWRHDHISYETSSFSEGRLDTKWIMEMLSV